MSKKPAKPAEEAQAGPKKKRSRLVLGLLALVPLVLAGGGYAGWMFLSPGAPGEAGAHAADAHDAEPAKDPVKVSSVPTEIAAEVSFTHSFALSVLLAERCGKTTAPALKAASDEEAAADGLMVSLSWQAAARRLFMTTEESCGRLRGEVYAAEEKAAALAAQRNGEVEGAEAKSAGHH